ncbi:uncharacterized protein LOC133792159 [Humulus lupulus]|uniref:uncharacterized protein LOC133792159 n=1 Tax=Humulus lupulus TaxID=3486 RepID=UPI002B403541|nr:uncharacterized protein LOC133792159 [Humulus lupulus]
MDELLEKLYSKLKVDRSLFDLKLEVSFTCNDFSVDLIEITDDEGVSALILDNSKSLRHRVPLCISSIAKNIALLDPSPRASVNMENHNQSYRVVPQTAPGPSVYMGGPSQNESFFPQQISRMMMGMNMSLMSMTIQLPILVMMMKELRVTLDANNHLYPVAFGIVDSENHDSWKYFMSNLKETIGQVEDLAFVSDRRASITHALETIFLDAYHGACYHHIGMNVIAEFKTDHCHVLMYNAAYAFRKSEFHAHFEKIKSKDPAIAQYLEGMGFDKWSRAYFPGNRYNIMTRNYAESFNNKTWDARSFPKTTFIEFIRFTLQSWFCDRRETSEKTTITLTPTYEKYLVEMAEKARFLIPYEIVRHEFHVFDGELNGEVDLLNKTCTCGVFQLIGIPYVHALSGSLKRGMKFYLLCLSYYKIETWRSSYT